MIHLFKGKGLLYLGLIMLTIGLLIRYLSAYQSIAFVLVIVGVMAKVIYLVSKIKKSTYRPGVELILLFVGLALFFTGIYMRSHNFAEVYPYFMITGIILKVAFIIMFIRKLA